MLDAYVVNVFDETLGSELAIGNAYRDLIVADGGANLLLYLPLDAAFGLTDQSGNGRNGTAVNAPVIGAATGPGEGIPTATDLDGVNQRITTTYSPFTNATVRTYEGWANRDTSTSVDCLFGGDVATVHPALRLASGSQNVLFVADMSGAQVTWTAAWPGNAQWVHWMVVFDEGGDTVKLYINGSLVSSQAHTVAYNAAPGNIAYGGRGAAGATDPFDGKMAHVAVYNTDKSSLAAAHAAAYPFAALTGTSSIYVVDLMDFNADPEGGVLNIYDGTNYTEKSYTVPTGSTSQITLASSLANNYAAGDKVNILASIGGERIVERWADIRQPDGEETLRALVPHSLRALIPMGPRDENSGESEHVRADFEAGDLVIQNVYGRPVTGIELEAGETNTPLDKDTVRWIRRTDGNVLGALQGYEDTLNAEDALWAIVYSTGAYPAKAGVWAGIRVGTPNFALLWTEVVNGQPSKVKARTTDASGFSSERIIVSGDGTSDFLLDTAWTNWTPTFTGWSVNPTGGVYRYKQIGKLVVAVIRQPNNGTSNATTASLTAPVAAATGTDYQWEAPASAVDNGAFTTTPARAGIASGSSTINFGKDFSAVVGGWTATGNKRIANCTLIYESA